ncbi:hypothetical protein AK88_04312 [Plasmodium fragile]|nr:uncharacterized protein AK88_04312 [Plasmodium fragile]KJP86055.1 hypothetical protein AK88_04312 [Plasmodium fragile]
MIYSKWAMNTWNDWKNEKIKEWITSEWKQSEDKYWSNYDEYTLQTLDFEDQKQWYKWKERIYREGVEWKNWIAVRESRFVNSNWNTWSDWKKGKQLQFSEWTETFVDNWIKQKQWLVWNEERKNAADEQKLAEEQVAAPSQHATPVSVEEPAAEAMAA